MTRDRGREGTLRSIGYVPLKLQKISGDSRFSGKFGVNGTPMRFLIDSGANSTDVSESYANQVGLKRDHSVSVISRGALGRAVKSGLGRGTLQMGPVFAHEFPFTIGPDPKLRTATSRYAGQIGLDAMTAAGSLIDIPRGALWVPSQKALLKSRGRPERLGAVKGLGYNALQLYPAGKLPHLILDSNVDGKRITWVVDTGAEVSVMAESSFQKLNLTSEVTNSRMIWSVLSLSSLLSKMCKEYSVMPRDVLSMEFSEWIFSLFQKHFSIPRLAFSTWAHRNSGKLVRQSLLF